MLRYCFSWAFLAVASTLHVAARADSVPDIANSVVIVHVDGVDTKNGNAPVSSEGTGFVISNDGLIATAYHLVSDLPNVQLEAAKFSIQTRRLGGVTVRAAYYKHDAVADVMILYAPISGLGLTSLTPGDRNTDKIEIASTPVFDPGFPAGLDYNVAQGQITSFNGPLDPPAPLWTTNLTFKSGQSGSPIVLGNGHVIALARGVDQDATQLGYIVPVRYIPGDLWDGLRISRNQAQALAGGRASPDRVAIDATVIPTSPSTKMAKANFQNNTCDAPQHKTMTVLADSGWSIDTNTIQITNVRSTGTVHSQIDAQSSGGFVVGVDLRNDGVCSAIWQWVFGRPSDVAASFEADVQYAEKLVNPLPVRLTVASAAAIGDATIPIPTNSISPLSFAVVRADGTKTPFAPNSSEIKFDKSGQEVLDVSKIVQRVVK